MCSRIFLIMNRNRRILDIEFLADAGSQYLAHNIRSDSDFVGSEFCRTIIIFDKKLGLKRQSLL